MVTATSFPFHQWLTANSCIQSSVFALRLVCLFKVFLIATSYLDQGNCEDYIHDTNYFKLHIIISLGAKQSNNTHLAQPSVSFWITQIIAHQQLANLWATHLSTSSHMHSLKCGWLLTARATIANECYDNVFQGFFVFVLVLVFFFFLLNC